MFGSLGIQEITLIFVLIIFFVSSIQKKHKKLKEEKMGNLTFLPRTKSNIYSKMEKEKHSILKNLGEIVEEKEIANSEITHAIPYSETEWVQLRFILNEENFSELQIRLTLKITIIGLEFHKYPFEYRLTLIDNENERIIDSIHTVNKSFLKSVIDHLIKREKLPLRMVPRFRLFPFQFWRLKNKVDRIKNSTLSTVASVFYIFGFLLLTIPAVGTILVVIAILFSFANWNDKRKFYIVTSGKPSQEPRNLSLIDSWQTVVFNIGNKANVVRTDLIKKLRSSLTKNVHCEEENIWYWGLDGKVERTQIVLRHNRGIVFVHIYPYGEDLYIGWDAHVNYGQWNENIAGEGYYEQTGDYVKLRGIEPGFQSVNEYDIQDVVSLAEWSHAQIAKTVKIIIKENNIDQEIDFNIIRERRAELTKKEAPKKSPFSRKSLFGFKRT
jgi:hypothetical protein